MMAECWVDLTVAAKGAMLAAQKAFCSAVQTVEKSVYSRADVKVAQKVDYWAAH